jgi:hypothetical protein
LIRPSYSGPGELDKELGDLFDQLDRQSDLGRDLCLVLMHLLLDLHGQHARDWLRGISLPDESLSALGLSSSNDEEDPES